MCITRLDSPNDQRPFLMQLHHHAKSPLAPIQQFLYPSGFRESLPVGYSLFYNWKSYI